MKKKHFEKLVASIKEAGEINAGRKAEGNQKGRRTHYCVLHRRIHEPFLMPCMRNRVLAFFLIVRLPCSIHAVRSVTHLTWVLIRKIQQKTLCACPVAPADGTGVLRALAVYPVKSFLHLFNRGSSLMEI